MANKITSLNWLPSKFENGTLTDSNHLGRALMTQPHIQDTLAYAFGDRFYLQFLTQGMGMVKDDYDLVSNVEYTWPVMGDILKANVISESAGANKGAGFEYFTLLFKYNYFFEGCVVRFASGIQARVTGPATQIGGDYQYTLQVTHSDASVFVPASDLVEGQKVAFAFTAYEEGSTKSGATNAFPGWFKNQLTILRHSREMTGSMATDVMILQVGDQNGKKSNLWMYASEYQDMLVWQTWVERMRWDGEYNRTPTGEIFNKGINGKDVKIGAGLLNQIAGSNTMTYNVLTTKVIDQFMGGLLASSRNPVNKKFMVFTGLGGFTAFQEAMRGRLAGNVISTTFVTKSGGKYTFDDNNFVTYKGVYGSEFTLVNCDLFDDPEYNVEKDADGIFTKRSHEFTFLDFSVYDGQPNISLVAKGGADANRKMLMWYEAGSMDPMNMFPGGKNWRMGSSSVDGCTKHKLSEQGIKLLMPNTCGRLVPSYA